MDFERSSYIFAVSAAAMRCAYGPFLLRGPRRTSGGNIYQAKGEVMGALNRMGKMGSLHVEAMSLRNVFPPPVAP